MERKGKQPAIVDADDLLEDPKAVLQEFCKRIELPFEEQRMLHWEACSPDSHFGRKLAPEGEWIAWFKDVMSSTGFSMKHNSTNSNKAVATANMKPEVVTHLE